MMWRTILLLGVALTFAGCKELDESELSGVKGFIMRNNLMCTIKQSTDTSEIMQKISFIGVRTDKPKVLISGQKGLSSITARMRKIFETSDTVTLQLIEAGTGGVETFVIDKKSGKFARATAGSLSGVYASASLGTCE